MSQGNLEQSTISPVDTLNQLAGLTTASAVTTGCARRDDVVKYVQASYDVLLGPEAGNGLSSAERAFAGLRVATLTHSVDLLASVATSRVNGCVYCASVHAQRYAQLTRQADVITHLLDGGVKTALAPRERVIVDFSVKLTGTPHEIDANDLAVLQAAGLTDLEILDLTHVVAMFAWANGLLQTLGEVIYD